MGGILKDRWSLPFTAVAHEFIDGYMAAANGEYVKVYLYVLRYQGESVTLERIADALNHTESDVRRAILYWEKLGVLASEPVSGHREGMSAQDYGMDGLSGEHGWGAQAIREQSAVAQEFQECRLAGKDFRVPSAVNRKVMIKEVPGVNDADRDVRNQKALREDFRNQDTVVRNIRERKAMNQDFQAGTAGNQDDQHSGTAAQQQSPAKQSRRESPAPVPGARAEGKAAPGARESTIEVREARDMPVYSPEQVNRLAQDEAFSQLLYIAQKYMDRVFTPRDCQVFAYLYEELGMSGEVLEYLVEYCVQNGHTSVRYIEAVARNWHERDIRTVLEAKDYSASYNKDSFAVMKAFGINGRKPAAPEQKLMDKWFKDYGFTREMVVEACSRTITAIHSPSFQYADKILGEWKKSDIRGMEDVKELDARHLADKEQNAQSREKRLQKYDAGVGSQGSRTRKGAPNQFHNFEQRDTDYDALMLKQVKEWVGQ